MTLQREVESEYDKSVHLDDSSHRILQKLAEKNYRSKRKQLQVILLEEAKRQGIKTRLGNSVEAAKV